MLLKNIIKKLKKKLNKQEKKLLWLAFGALAIINFVELFIVGSYFYSICTVFFLTVLWGLKLEEEGENK